MNKRFVLVIWIHAGETQLSKCRGNDQSHCGTDMSDQREPPEHPWVFVVQMDHNFRHYHWSQCAFINMNTFGFMPTCTFFKHKKFLKKKKLQCWKYVNYLSMFLLFALRRATIPALASASKENGSIPYTERNCQTCLTFCNLTDK